MRGQAAALGRYGQNGPKTMDLSVIDGKMLEFFRRMSRKMLESGGNWRGGVLGRGNWRTVDPVPVWPGDAGEDSPARPVSAPEVRPYAATRSAVWRAVSKWSPGLDSGGAPHCHVIPTIPFTYHPAHHPCEKKSGLPRPFPLEAHNRGSLKGRAVRLRCASVKPVPVSADSDGCGEQDHKGEARRNPQLRRAGSG